MQWPNDHFLCKNGYDSEHNDVTSIQKQEKTAMPKEKLQKPKKKYIEIF